MPRVTVITPCYNAARFVGETIDSVRAQSFEDWEYILVDDGSTDTTPEILHDAQSDPRIRVISKTNGGCASARNRGLESAQDETEFVAFLDSDDLWYPHTLDRLVRALDEDPSSGVVLGYAVQIDDRARIIEDRGRHDRIFRALPTGVVADDAATTLSYDHFLPVNPISSPGQCLIRAGTLADDLRFDEEIVQSEDWEFWLRLSRSTTFRLIKDPTLMYRRHAEGKSTNYRRMHEFRAFVYERQLRDAHDFPETLTKVRAAYPFGMFGMDAGLCASWAREAARTARPVEAARLLVRSLRYRTKAFFAERAINRRGGNP